MAPIKSLEGKVVIVTGAGRGIGREIALLCAAEGAKVVVNDPGGAADGSGSSAAPAEEVVEEIKKRGGTAVANFETVAEAVPASRIVKTAIDSFGKLDGVVNNAGILRDAIFHRMSIDAFESVIKVHLMGSFYVSHAAARLFREQESGAFVHFTSTSAWSAITARPITPRPSSASSGCRNRSRSTWNGFTSAPTACRRSPGAG